MANQKRLLYFLGFYVAYDGNLWNNIVYIYYAVFVYFYQWAVAWNKVLLLLFFYWQTWYDFFMMLYHCIFWHLIINKSIITQKQTILSTQTSVITNNIIDIQCFIVLYIDKYDSL